MNKNILRDYIDACELIKEIQLELDRLEGKRSTIVLDKVTGSMSEFPYSQASFKVEGAIGINRDEKAIRTQKLILTERKKKAERIKLEVEKWLNTVPVRMQRIIRYKFFEGISWEEVADRMGRNTTGDGLRKEFERFMKEI